MEKKKRKIKELSTRSGELICAISSLGFLVTIGSAIYAKNLWIGVMGSFIFGGLFIFGAFLIKLSKTETESAKNDEKSSEIKNFEFVEIKHKQKKIHGKHCIKCGKSVSKKAKYCQNCGAKKKNTL